MEFRFVTEHGILQFSLFFADVSKYLIFKKADLYPYLGWTFSGLPTDGGAKRTHVKICHTYPTMMKLGTVIPCLKKFQKYVNHVTHHLSSAEISIFFTRNQQI